MSFLSSLFGGGPAAGVPTPSYVSPALYGLAIPGQTTQAPTGAIDPNAVGGQYYGGVGNLGGYNTYGSLLPQAMGIGQGMVNDPSAMQYLQGAMTGSGLGTGAAFNQYGAGANLYGLGGPTIQTAFDPQNALYNRTLQQTLGQQMGSLYGAGLGTTPLGQSILGNTLGNFNIDWQQAQQGRQLAGLQALNQLYPTAANLQGTAAPLFMQSAGMPWQAGQTIGGQALNTLGGLGGFGTNAANIPQMQLQDYYNLMGWGTGAQNQAFQQAQMAGVTDPMAIAGAQNAFNQNLFQDQLARAQASAAETTGAWTGIGSMVGNLGTLGAGLGKLGWSPFGSPQQTSTARGLQYGGEMPVEGAVVGEGGPEYFKPKVPGTIVPNPQTQAQMGQMPGTGWPGGGSGMQMAGGGDGIWAPFGQPNIPPESGMGGLGGIGTFKPQFGRGWQYGGAA